MANGLKAPPHPQASEKVLAPKKALINKLRISTQGGVQVELWPKTPWNLEAGKVRACSVPRLTVQGPWGWALRLLRWVGRGLWHVRELTAAHRGLYISRCLHSALSSAFQTPRNTLRKWRWEETRLGQNVSKGQIKFIHWKQKRYTIGQELEEEELWDGLLVEEGLEQIVIPK